MSEEAADVGEPSQRPCDIGLVGIQESQALSPAVLSCTRVLCGSLGQVSSGEEQRRSVLLACKGAGRS